MDRVTVTVPARLHLGFLDPDGTLGRRFGSIGLALDRPATRVTLTHARQARVTGPEAARAADHLARLAPGRSFALDVEEAIPPHAGLGSGTALALAVAAAVRTLDGARFDAAADAALLDRGARSGIGIGLFETGGLAVDGGCIDGGGPAPLVARLPFPEGWRILLLLDRGAQGLHGDGERKAFAALPRFAQRDAAHLCHLVLMKLLPALAAGDIGAFGSAVAEIQGRLGDHFAVAQGGRFASARVAAAAKRLADAGAHDVGQSSWGPAGFAFAASESDARRLADSVRTNDVETVIARARNGPALIVSNVKTMPREKMTA